MRKPLEKLEIEKNSKTKEKVSNNRITRDIRTNNVKLSINENHYLREIQGRKKKNKGTKLEVKI